MLKLGVNIDHVATVREARYRGMNHGEPSPVAAAVEALQAGAHGITAHLREDRRHIQDHDVFELRRVVTNRLNLEMANSPEILQIALKLKPDIVCLVPERRQEITTEGGLEVVGNLSSLRQTVSTLKSAGIEVSLFIAPVLEQVEASAQVGAQFIELHTGTFAERFREDGKAAEEVERLISASQLGKKLGLQINAGHGLNLSNLPALFAVPNLVELNIGHSIVSRALSVGMRTAVSEFLQLMSRYSTAETS
jgi:pyridoxine 5-phosphate synthase